MDNQGLNPRGVIATPIKQVAENRFAGGLHDFDGLLDQEGVHRRSFTGDIHIADPSAVSAATKHLSSIDKVEETCLYGGILFNHFGHFLIESLGRLWIADQLGYSNFPIYMSPMWAKIDLQDRKHFIVATLELLGIEASRIRLINRACLFSAIIIPPQLYGFHLLDLPDPRLRAMLDRVEARLSSQVPQMETPKRVYVSRSLWRADKGRMAGEREFEAFLLAEGWAVFHPQMHSFATQLLHYRNAEELIFSEGSAFHSLILLPGTRARIYVIMRRPAGWNQARLQAQCAGFGQRLRIFQFVQRILALGLPIWAGVSIVDLCAVVEELRQVDLAGQDFADWSDLKDDAIDRDLSEYVNAVARDPRFLQFLRNNDDSFKKSLAWQGNYTDRDLSDYVIANASDSGFLRILRNTSDRNQ